MTQANPSVVIETSKGDITVELNAEKAPLTVANFLAYVEEDFFAGTIFHRVISNFMIQGGGMTPDMRQKPTKSPVKNEADNGLKNDRGTIAMARTGVVDSATAQFFINVENNTFLNFRGKSPDAYGYAVFGKVTAGLEVVDAIRAVKTTSKGMHDDVPAEAITIKTIRRA
ncbi:MAG: peptidylprolyl isomerase [Phycisphaerae bacterium]|nr:peptidylprolyl isomerase [Phycisphaerae bacterium]